MRKKQFILKQGEDEFIIGFFGADLYWIMLNYHENNKFIITKEQEKLYDFIKFMFAFMKLYEDPQLKDDVFFWLSEARLPEESNHMTITKLKDNFVVQFFQNPYDYISKASKTCAICFCLSGSKNWNVASMFGAQTHKLLAED